MSISDKLYTIQESKLAIKNAIEAKGVTVGDAPLTDYADLIESIPTGTSVQDNALTLTAKQAGSTVKLTQTGSPTVSGLKYRTSTSASWSAYTIDTVITLTNVDDYVQFMNTESTLSTSMNDYVKFVMTGLIAGSGNVQSMLNFSSTLSQYCYRGLFSGCASLTTAPEIPATSLPNYCYRSMFYGCTSLTHAPEFPATTIGNSSCLYMFSECTSLTTAPEFNANTVSDSSLYGMFYNCTSLRKVLSFPPATTLAENCYRYMFYGCSNLIYVPSVLPATTLARSCYADMFERCTSLTTAPTLPATNLVIQCYYYMFENCSSLTQVPELPATTLPQDCYYHMFKGCTSLSLMNVNFDDWGIHGQTNTWLGDVSATGIFIKPTALSEEFSTGRIPTGWTVVNK